MPWLLLTEKKTVRVEQNTLTSYREFLFLAHLLGIGIFRKIFIHACFFYLQNYIKGIFVFTKDKRCSSMGRISQRISPVRPSS